MCEWSREFFRDTNTETKLLQCIFCLMPCLLHVLLKCHPLSKPAGVFLVGVNTSNMDNLWLCATCMKGQLRKLSRPDSLGNVRSSCVKTTWHTHSCHTIPCWFPVSHPKLLWCSFLVMTCEWWMWCLLESTSCLPWTGLDGVSPTCLMAPQLMLWKNNCIWHPGTTDWVWDDVIYQGLQKQKHSRIIVLKGTMPGRTVCSFCTFQAVVSGGSYCLEIYVSATFEAVLWELVCKEVFCPSGPCDLRELWLTEYLSEELNKEPSLYLCFVSFE